MDGHACEIEQSQITHRISLELMNKHCMQLVHVMTPNKNNISIDLSLHMEFCDQNLLPAVACVHS